MKINEKLENIISDEKRKLDKDSEEIKKLKKNCEVAFKERFSKLSSFLATLSKEISSEHAKIRIYNYGCLITVQNRRREEKMHRFIQIDICSENDKRTLISYPVKGVETVLWDAQEKQIEKKHFPDDEDVMEYILEKLGKKIAYLQHSS